jgi:hypothetical protein
MALLGYKRDILHSGRAYSIESVFDRSKAGTCVGSNINLVLGPMSYGFANPGRQILRPNLVGTEEGSAVTLNGDDQRVLL